MRRRTVLLSASTVAITGATTGCLGSNGNGGDGNTSNETNDTTDSTPPVNATFGVTPRMPSAGAEVTLDAGNSTGNVESYEWELPSETASGETVTTSFSEAGEYEVTLTVTGADGTSASTTQRVIAVGVVEGTVTTQGSIPPVVGQELTLQTVRVPGDASEYRWDIDGDGNTDETTSESSTTYTFTDPGERELTLELVRSDGTLVRVTERLTVISRGDYVIQTIEDADRRLEQLVAEQNASESVVTETRDLVELAGEILRNGSNVDTDVAQPGTLQRIADIQQILLQDYRASMNVTPVVNSAFSEISGQPLLNGNPQPFAETLSSMNTANDTVQGMQSDRSELQTLQQQVEPITIDGEEIDYTGEIPEYLVFDQSELQQVSRVVELFRQLFQAYRDLAAGRRAFQNERWQEAVDLFSSSESSLREVDELSGRIGTTPPGIIDIPENAFSPELIIDAVATHSNAATAGLNGRTEAAERIFTSATQELSN